MFVIIMIIVIVTVIDYTLLLSKAVTALQYYSDKQCIIFYYLLMILHWQLSAFSYHAGNDKDMMTSNNILFVDWKLCLSSFSWPQHLDCPHQSTRSKTCSLPILLALTAAVVKFIVVFCLLPAGVGVWQSTPSHSCCHLISVIHLHWNVPAPLSGRAAG